MSRPRRFSAPAARRSSGAGAGRAGAPPAPRRRVRGASSSSASQRPGAPRRRARALAAAVASARRSASWRLRSALRLVSSSCLRRSSSSRLRASAAARSARSMLPRGCGARASSSATLALFGFAQPRVGERMRAGAALFLGQRAQHDAGGFGAARPAAVAASRRRRRGAGLRRRGALRRRARARAAARLGLGLARAADAALDLLDDDRLAAAMAEALAHDALLDAAALERQRLGRVRSAFRRYFWSQSFAVLVPYVCACHASSSRRSSWPRTWHSVP